MEGPALRGRWPLVLRVRRTVLCVSPSLWPSQGGAAADPGSVRDEPSVRPVQRGGTSEGLGLRCDPGPRASVAAGGGAVSAGDTDLGDLVQSRASRQFLYRLPVGMILLLMGLNRSNFTGFF